MPGNITGPANPIGIPEGTWVLIIYRGGTEIRDGVSGHHAIEHKCPVFRTRQLPKRETKNYLTPKNSGRIGKTADLKHVLSGPASPHKRFPIQFVIVLSK